MIPLIVKVTATLPRKRDLNRIRNVCNRAAGIEVRDLLPLHFEAGAQQRFRYQFRSKQYNRRKQRIFGHQKPLVFTGRMRQSVLRTARVTATSKGAKVQANTGTRGFRSAEWRRQRKLELEAVTKQQQRTISDNYSKRFTELAQLPEFQTTTKG